MPVEETAELAVCSDLGSRFLMANELKRKLNWGPARNVWELVVYEELRGLQWSNKGHFTS